MSLLRVPFPRWTCQEEEERKEGERQAGKEEVEIEGERKGEREERSMG